MVHQVHHVRVVVLGLKCAKSASCGSAAARLAWATTSGRYDALFSGARPGLRGEAAVGISAALQEGIDMTRTIRKILVATDFSECGDAALSAAMELAEA